MNPPHVVAGAWAAANAVLALVLLLFRPDPLPFFLFLSASALVAAFAVVVLWAQRTGRTGVQLRQPHRARSAMWAAFGLAIVLTGFAYGWWVSLLGAYPLAMAAASLRGERLPPGARPWPAALDGTEPAGRPKAVYEGSALGRSVEVPERHPARGPRRRAPAGARAAALVVAALAAVVRSVFRRLRKGHR